MIDLHTHILPRLDDGAKTLDESIKMCRISYNDGVRTIVATPHILKGVYENNRSTILTKVQELNTALLQSAISHQLSAIKVLPGADVHFSSDLVQLYEREEILTLNDKRRYLLVEFSFQGVPSRAEEVLFQLLAKGITPIISHPERNLEIGQRPQRYYEMIRMGCLGQVTGMSLTGEFGPGVRRIAEKLLTHRLLHFIASDAHSCDGRPPILSHAIRVAEKIVGKEEAQKMVTEYPQTILEGRKPNVPEPLSP